MLGLLGIGAGILGFGAQSRGQNAARDQRIGAINEQDKALDEQLEKERKAYREALRRGGFGFGSGDFASQLFAGRQFTGF